MKPTQHTAGESTALRAHVVDYGTYQDWHTHAPVLGTPDPNPRVRNEPHATVERRRRRDGWTAERQRIS